MASSNVLQLVYPTENIYIVGYEFDDPLRAINVTCRVPINTSYTLTPIPYVTAENHVRCLSQASYLLADHILENRLLPIEVTVEAFRAAAARYELYYRSLAMTFHAQVRPGEEFRMSLVLKNWKEIKRFQDFILFTFTNQRTVISGEMSFVFANS